MTKLKLVPPPKKDELPGALGIVFGLGALVNVCWVALKGALSTRKD